MSYLKNYENIVKFKLFLKTYIDKVRHNKISDILHRFLNETSGQNWGQKVKQPIIWNGESTSLCSRNAIAHCNTTTKMLICPGWETHVVPVSQPGTPVQDKRGCPFVPGLATGTKENLLSGAPFCPGWCYQSGQKVLFFHVFLFSIFFISIILLHFN